ncbi:hypothetical protein HU200_021407 [Digitaria exilis]|uniref:HMA domain-containing protein n=1 Tax=Digitaria exilis TaxID=1010633 RepID=A0A835KD42_9POAL|nr:hypothetical protein HU200_021407 [Digitaria exilis]
MDCNGCQHKIRKTLSAIDGVSEVYVDQANHKVTVVGVAGPERIIKAIRKTKRVPTIFSHIDPAAEAQPPPAEAEASPPAEPPADAPPAEAAPAEPTPETKEEPPPETLAMDSIVKNKMHDYTYGDGHPMDMHGVGYDAAPYHVTHRYSHHGTSPYIAEYGYGGSPDQEGRYYSYNYYLGRGKGDGSQITSIFSDENPNACSIV